MTEYSQGIGIFHQKIFLVVSTKWMRIISVSIVHQTKTTHNVLLILKADNDPWWLLHRVNKHL